MYAGEKEKIYTNIKLMRAQEFEVAANNWNEMIDGKLTEDGNKILFLNF